MITIHTIARTDWMSKAETRQSIRMSCGIACITAGLISMSLVVPALAAPSFEGLGVLPGGTFSQCYGLSSDGKTVLGWSAGTMFRWTKVAGFQTFVGLPGSTGHLAMAISADGNVVAGRSWMVDGSIHGFRWTAANVQDIGVLPGRLNTYVFGISGDGNAVVGESGPAFAAVRWTQEQSLIQLIPDSLGMSNAYAASYDGSVVVGVVNASSGAQAIRWTEAAGVQFLESLPDGTSMGAYSVSDDGSFIAGVCSGSAFGSRAVRWTPSGVHNLGLLPDGRDSWADYISGDGRTVVGRAETNQFEHFPMIWNEAIGMVTVEDYFHSFGLDLSGWTIEEVRGISYNGRTLAGYGIHNGRSEAWIATLGCSGDFNGDGAVDFSDYMDFVEAFLLNSVSADFNSDGEIDFFDYLDFVDAFSRGC